MATKARRFKRKLAQKPVRKKAEPVLSVELIRKETIEKVQGLFKRLVAFTMNHEQKTNN